MLLHNQDSHTSLIPCAKITHIVAWSLLDVSYHLLLHKTHDPRLVPTSYYHNLLHKTGRLKLAA